MWMFEAIKKSNKAGHQLYQNTAVNILVME